MQVDSSSSKRRTVNYDQYRTTDSLTNGQYQAQYPLPLIEDIVHKFAGKKWFTKFDVWWGYNKWPIVEEDQWKAAFKTKRGLFKSTVMFFGLCNSPATF